ncbi:MAG: ATP-binding protein [Chlamydiales bacterium]
MKFPIQLEHLGEMMGYLRKRGKELRVPLKAIQKMELACEEAIVNIISYSSPSKGDALELSCDLLEETHFQAVIRDRGRPFNPLEAPIDPQNEIPVSERRIGGLGLYLIRKLIDEAVYIRAKEENVLRLTLRLEVPQEAENRGL